MSLLRIASFVKWQSTSMCLILSWKVGLLAMKINDWLSQNKLICNSMEILNYGKRLRSYFSSQVIWGIALYFASQLDLATMLSFFTFPWEQITSNKCLKPQNGLSIIYVSCIISIGIGLNFCMSTSIVEKTLPLGSFDILKYFKHDMPMK